MEIVQIDAAGNVSTRWACAHGGADFYSRWGKLSLGLAMTKLLIVVELTCLIAEDRRQENCDQETN